MNSQTPSLSPQALQTEVDTRLVQALDNFFQRSRPAIHDGILRELSNDPSPSRTIVGQVCTDWLSQHPDQLSDAFATCYRAHLAQSSPSLPDPESQTGELHLLDDATLDRQLSVSKSGRRLTDTLFPEMQPFLGRMSGLLGTKYAETLLRYSPQAVVCALSDALDALKLEVVSGTLLLQQAMLPLQDTLRHTYVALNQYLQSRGVAQYKELPLPKSASQPAPTPSAGSDVLTHIQRAISAGDASGSHYDQNVELSGSLVRTADSRGFLSGASGMTDGFLPALASFQDSLDRWQASPPVHPSDSGDTPVLVLRQLQAHAQTTDAAHFDLAMLDAVAGLFEFILDDTDVSVSYKSAIAQLQIPALRVALASPDFFRDDNHPARRTLDLMGLFSRRFPEGHTEYTAALAEVEASCLAIGHQPTRQIEAFTEAHDRLTAWLATENLRADAAMAADVARLELIERQELGTLLALENLQDLTARYPAPVSVLRQLEMAWVPHMASLYVEESGEGPAWREAGATLLNLFLSLQAPPDDATREQRLQTLPQINSALRNGLLAQQADSAQLREFFAALTAAQECWIRPDISHREAPVSHFEPAYLPASSLEAKTRHTVMAASPDMAWQQADALREGDWVDFSPPYEGLDTARVAWVGVQGYLLFCDSGGETRFSLDSAQLADAIRAGHASVPEQSLTRKAMLRLREQFQNTSN